MRYYVVLEQADDGGWGAYPPDIPGVGVVADTQAQVLADVKRAIELHIEGLRAHGLPIPHPSGEFVEVAVA